MSIPDSETIAVIGAGRVGRALARRAAVAGFRVVLEDLIPTSLEHARREIRQTLNDAVNSGTLEQGCADEAFARIDCATTIEDAARRAHIVMETGPDEQESKLEMFCLLDRICLPNTVIVSNCHALELSDTASKAESIVGMYFSGDRAEIHCSTFTSERALAVAKRLAERMASSYKVTREGHSAAKA
jgi:3-hydroxybutyryl-CoA dehydrogenase